MSPHRTDHAPETLDPEGDTPPAHPRRRSSERNEAVGPSPFETRRRTPAVLTEKTRLNLSIGALAAIGVVLAGLLWRVSSQVQHIDDRLLLEERTLRVVAKKVGVEAIDLSPEREEDTNR